MSKARTRFSVNRLVESQRISSLQTETFKKQSSILLFIILGVLEMEENEQGSEQPKGIPTIAGAQENSAPEEIVEESSKTEKKEEFSTHLFALRTTANREDQVMDFLTSNVKKKKLAVYSAIRPHGMRGYIFLEAGDRQNAEQAAFNVPYARGILRNEIDYKEIEHMLEQVKVEMNIQKHDIVEIISGPFKREQARVTRVDQTKEEVVVELLEAAVPIPITVKLDSVKVVRRDEDDDKKGKGK